MENKKETNETSLANMNEVSTCAINSINLLNPKHYALAESFMKRMMGSSKSGIKSVADGIAVLSRAQDLQLPFSSCIEHIHVISGKTGIDVHIIKALLSRAGVIWEKVKDYTPLYNYTDGDNIYPESLLPLGTVKCISAKQAEERTNDDVIGVYPVRYYADLNNQIYSQFQINDKCVVCLNRPQALAIAKKGEFPIIRIAPQPYDYIVEYKFTRTNVINGREVTRSCISKFTYSEAVKAGFFEKDNYVKYGRIMIDHRAFTLGARDIASDLLMGCQELTELKQSNGYSISEADFDTDDIPLVDAETVETANN